MRWAILAFLGAQAPFLLFSLKTVSLGVSAGKMPVLPGIISALSGAVTSETLAALRTTAPLEERCAC
jgi:hypothetical protein